MVINIIDQLAIAQWICLQLPSCHPGFESQAHDLHFCQFIFELGRVEKTKITKRGRDRPIFKNFYQILITVHTMGF